MHRFWRKYVKRRGSARKCILGVAKLKSKVSTPIFPKTLFLAPFRRDWIFVARTRRIILYLMFAFSERQVTSPGVTLLCLSDDIIMSHRWPWSEGRHNFHVPRMTVCHMFCRMTNYKNLQLSHSRTVVRECYKRDDESQWEIWHPATQNTLTHGHQSLWLGGRVGHVTRHAGQLSHMAGHETNPATKFETSTPMHSWVNSYKAFHWIPLILRFWLLRMRRITWPVRRG